MCGETLALTPALSPGERGNRSPSHDKSSASPLPGAADVSPSPGGEGRGEGGTFPPIRDINNLITLNLDIRQFAQDVIENCEGPEMLRAFWQAITTITVLDLTCGSGAFLFAALNILEPLYEACLDRMEAFVEDLERSGEKHRPEKLSDFRKILERVAAHPNRRYFIFKSIILNNLFGVDIMEEAVEICKLRLFLKLAAQVEPDAARDNLGIEPLTAHHVFVLGLCKEAIPGIRTAEYPGTDADYYEEQRRLFYVTITRSRETLVLSRPKKIKPGDAQKLNLRVGAPEFHYSKLQMCPFLRDIMDTLPAAVDGENL
ncbi:MAG: hypothetical protein HY298_06425 [Verrucomicrobia bacterium]|nr:hypothetical protein [Verrucomicrobiota bacterium]